MASTRPRVPKTVSSPEQQKTPEAFVIPTPLLVDVINLIGKIPAAQVGTVFLQLQQLQPLAEPEVEGG